ncbi:ATP-binding cassette domain-containing protein [Oryzifoliimicrobium ureilyticus]|uniref:ATP-binding cassette domain-containing protein n=1 Tax=Oryzifoliimicrobium ureilyticus TaxID=3113724 RepID=UPI00307616CA
MSKLSPGGIAACAASLLLLLVIGFFAERRQAEAEMIVAEKIWKNTFEQLERLPLGALQAIPSGALITALQRHPRAIAALAVGNKLASIMLFVGPLAAAVVIAPFSWQAALLLCLASPVLIAFFILFGSVIHARASQQEKALGRLAAQFEDRVRTLPTIVASHGLKRQSESLDARMGAYANSTVAVLKIAFLNAGVIDFFASLSIAVLAVFLGLGHLKLIALPGFSDIALWQSLMILMLAPEFFAPFRRYAEQYHTKAEGHAAAQTLDKLLFETDAQRPSVSSMSISSMTLKLPPKGLVAIVGRSGIGKSTLLRHLCGLEGGNETYPQSVDWLSTDTYISAGTLASAIGWNRGKVCPTRLLLVASRVGLLDDASLPEGLNSRIEAGGLNLSGGQRLRLSVARSLLSDRNIFADEPTAKLDPCNAERVRLALADSARERLVVVATHDRQLAAMASQVIDLEQSDVPVKENTL